MLNQFTPFTGLGFDLTMATEKCRDMILSRFEDRDQPFFQHDYTPWGFDLLIHLNRETGGS
ncbi:hypothetical protein [Desulfonatronovibrio hydrogenovorans]|uniref:hypothetical protein n=1 Tax=Desulfonatronovibrio hydrogenovorans TaxID=53245 RepID=UPI000490BABE|nr:hypothetical protein [Desulfonatronovibrio hydrogenovorans]